MEDIHSVQSSGADDTPQMKSPHVKSITTNSGRTRFNPNIYTEGKVCLSILGTWRGEPGEEWSSAQGLESILLSIQSLMSGNPYENEPGFENTKKEDPQAQAYVKKIKHETLRIAVLQRLEGLLGIDENKNPASALYKDIANKSTSSMLKKADEDVMSESGTSTPSTEASVYEYNADADLTDEGVWDPFADLIKRRFLWYYDTYVKGIEAASEEVKDGQAFARAQFEHPPNSMEGHFDYKGLRKRLDRVSQTLESERASWEKSGAAQVESQSQLANMLAFQFKQLEHQWNKGDYDGSRVELNLPNSKNPFVWNLTLFGAPMSNLDGGIFNMTLSIPPTFPDAQPRLKFETPIFHHRVSSQGYLCYFPAKPDEIQSHITAIKSAIEDERQTFDPRAVLHPEAFDLYWGGPEKRKVYSRKLRRSAQESCEY